ncbi:MAG: extracellular solute-binding protein [Lachnospirales bacterium]
MKKNLKALTAAVLCVALMAGCSSSGEDTAKDAPKEEQNVEVTVDDDGREMKGNMYTAGLPVVKEQESFTLFVDDSGMPEDKIMYPILEEQTNIKVDLMLYPYETAKEKLNILLNSGDYPDVIGGWILDSNAILKNGMRDQIYVPLDPYFSEESTPNIMEVLDVTNVRQTMTLPDGHIYSIPYIIGTPTTNFLPWINGKWLKELNLEMPTTPEEFKEVLIAFRDADLNGNGQADEIPFSSDPNNLTLQFLAGWWGDAMETDSGQNYFAMEDGKLAFKASSEGFKSMIEYFADLYSEGLVDPEMFTQDLATWKAKGNQDLYGSSIAYGCGDFYEIDKYREDITAQGDFLPLPVLKGIETPNYTRGSYGATIFKNQVVVTGKCENPEVVARWFDNVFEFDNSVQMNGGLYGKRIEKIEEGRARFISESKVSAEDMETYDWANMFTQSLPRYMPIDYDIEPPEGEKNRFDDKDLATLYTSHI